MNVDAHAVSRHLGERRGEPSGAAVLQRDDEVPLHEVERDLDQRLAAERVADLDGRSLLVGALEILRSEHRCPADPVAAGEGSIEDEQVADALRLGREDALGREDPDAHRVYERIGGIGLVERALAPDIRDADAVAVVPDSGDRALEVPVGLAEAEAVQQRDRPCSHRHDVAEDPADPGRGSLERLDGGRMVVRLGLERDRDAVAQVDHAGILARALEHPFAGRRQPLQEQRRVLVAAMLRPEQGKHGELEVVRRTTKQFADTVVLPVGQTETAVERFRDRTQKGSVSAAPDVPSHRTAFTAVTENR